MNTVVLVDDHPLLLRGLQEIIATAPDFRVIGATTSSAEGLSLIVCRRPDIAVLDVAMPGMGGLEILQALQEGRHLTKAIFLTATISGTQIAEALRTGLSGLLLKEYAPEQLLDCMREVALGRKWLPKELVSKASLSNEELTLEKFRSLTTREREIAALVCNGLSNRAIASKIGTTEGTVAIHLHNIFQKLEIGNRTTLAALHIQYATSKNT